MIYDLHVHSIYSKDSLLKPSTILRVARKKGLSGVAVTDHNSIKGGLMTLKMNTDKNFHVIVGSEIKTEYGDIIGLFLQDDIKSHTFICAVEEIKEQGGSTILAHPFRQGAIVPAELIKSVDAIEGFNSRSTKLMNKQALYLATQFNKPFTAGSDAHMWFELAKGRTIIPYDLKKSIISNTNTIEGETSNFFLSHFFSVGIEQYKRLIK